MRPGLLYDEVSDLLHGDGPLVTASKFDACELLDPAQWSSTLDAGTKILDLVEVCIDRLRNCIAAFAMEADGSHKRVAGFVGLSLMTERAGVARFPAWSLWPLNLTTGLSPVVVAQLDEYQVIINEIHKGRRPAGRYFRDDEMAELFFVERRSRAANAALDSFEHERIKLGKLNPEALEMRETNMILVTESLSLLARWSVESILVSSALATAASSLRSAFWLWLEDDDRAMGILRVALESLSRVETCNRNPVKAARIYKNEKSTPRDWLEAAGWRRLHVLNVALGEMAHTRQHSRWSSARSLLAELLPDSIDPEDAPYRARGFALDSVLGLGARVALESIQGISEEIHETMSKLFEEMQIGFQSPAELERWMCANWSNRSYDFGEGDFIRPTEAIYDEQLKKAREALQSLE